MNLYSFITNLKNFAPNTLLCTWNQCKIPTIASGFQLKCGSISCDMQRPNKEDHDNEEPLAASNMGCRENFDPVFIASPHWYTTPTGRGWAVVGCVVPTPTHPLPEMPLSIL